LEGSERGESGFAECWLTPARVQILTFLPNGLAPKSTSSRQIESRRVDKSTDRCNLQNVCLRLPSAAAARENPFIIASEFVFRISTKGTFFRSACSAFSSIVYDYCLNCKGFGAQLNQ